MRIRSTLLAAPLLLALCLLLAPARSAEPLNLRTEFIGLSMEAPYVVSTDTEARLVGSVLLFADWSEEPGDASPVAAVLTIRVSNADSAFLEITTVPLPAPTAPGLQDVGNLDAFALDVPPVAPGEEAVTYTVEAAYEVVYGPGRGTGTSLTKSRADVIVLSSTPSAPVTVRPVVPDAGVFEVRPGETIPVHVALANNLPDTPVSIRLEFTPSWANVLPEGSDPDGASYDPSEGVARPTLVGPLSTDPLTPPATLRYESLLGAGRVELPSWDVTFPSDAVPGHLGRLNLTVDWDEEDDGPPHEVPSSFEIAVWFLMKDLPPQDRTPKLQVVGNTGAFSTYEFSAIELDDGAALFDEPQGDTVFSDAHRQLIGIGARGWTLDSYTDVDESDLGRVEDLDELVARYSAHLSRGTFVQTISHARTTVRLPGQAGAYRVHEVSRGLEQSSNWDVEVDFTRDLILIYNPGGNGTKRQKLLQTPYSTFLDDPPDGYHVFNDSWIEFRVPGPFGSVDRITVDGWNPDLGAQQGATRLSAVAAGSGGGAGTIIVKTHGQLDLDAPGLGTGSVDVPVSTTVPIPETPGLLTGLIEVATTGNVDTDSRTYVAGWGRRMLEQHIPGLDVPVLKSVFGPVGKQADRTSLVMTLTPKSPPIDPAGKRRIAIPQECREVVIDVAGVITRLTLDERGKAKSADKTRKAKAKIKRAKDGTETVQLELKLKKLSLSPAFADEGVALEDVKKPGREIDIPVKVVWCGTLYAGTARVNLRGKHAKSAKLKPVK